MRTGAAKPGRGTHTREGASGFCNRAHVHEYTIVDEGRYFTQPPLFTGTFLQREPLARVAYIVLVGGICILLPSLRVARAHLGAFARLQAERSQAITYLSLLGLTAVRILGLR